MTFRAPRILRNGHLQTLAAAIPYGAGVGHPREAQVEAWRVPIESRDGLVGQAHGDAWMRAQRAPAVLVVHGIGGSSESAYGRRMARAIFDDGMHVIRVNLRGAGTSICDAPDLYHAGLTADVRAFVRRALADDRVTEVSLVGFSGGGNIALRLAADDEGPSMLRRVVSAGAPVHLPSVSSWIDGARALPYRRYVLRALVEQAREHARRRERAVAYSPDALSRWGTIRAYDTAVIAPMHGYASVDDYYQDASAAHRLSMLRVPSLVIHADDDPMVPRHAVEPYLEHASSAVRTEITRSGGHIGWLELKGAVMPRQAWLHRRVLRYLRHGD